VNTVESIFFALTMTDILGRTRLLEQLRGGLTGRYEVEREIGRGGMATVFLARDVRHSRRVALKVLDPELGAVVGAERFLAEIKVTANLQHPNLLPLFDSGEAGGLLFYVMPFVEGESLRARLEREKQLSVDDALRLAIGIASALDYAHRHGVIHRDLKPENILLHDGQPLVADFGIALALSNAGGQRITQTGLSLGTPHYMSPEQATGDRDLDARTDIYSLGAVLYEMLAGEPPYTGNTAQAVVSRVLTERPRALRTMRPSVPDHVDAAVTAALEKLPADRFATSADFIAALDGRASPRSGSSRAPRVFPRRRALIAVAAVGVAALATLAFNALRSLATDRAAKTIHFPLMLGVRERLADGVGNPFAISPDGQVIAYAASRPGSPPMLFVRRLSELRARELTGTDGAFQPAFSPDGQWIAFAAGAFIKKVSVAGGTPLQLAPVPSTNVRGIAWAGNDAIVIGRNNGVMLRAPAAGGDTARLPGRPIGGTVVDERWPVVLADGRTIVFVAYGGGFLGGSRIWVRSVDRDDRSPLDLVGSAPLGMIDDELLYVSPSSAVTAVKFDARRRRLEGAPRPVLDQVLTDPTSANARAVLSIDGSLIYQGGSIAASLVIADEHGATQPLLSEERAYSHPRFSPDGRRVAVEIAQGGGSDVWVFDRVSKTLTRLTSGGGSANDRPEWTHDGKRILFRSTREATGLWWLPADRSDSAERLLRLAGQQINEGVFSPDGQWLLYRTNNPTIPQDLWYRRVSGDTTRHAFITSQWYETAPRFSPNGKWVAYQSEESGTREVYVTPFPGPGPRIQVSVAGGSEPVWSPDGRRLFYAHNQAIIAASVIEAPSFSVVSRSQLFEGEFLFTYTHANYDVSPSRKEFVLVKGEGEAQAFVIHDWRAQLRARANDVRK
jgi:Tol biopolymer transport system component